MKSRKIKPIIILAISSLVMMIFAIVFFIAKKSSCQIGMILAIVVELISMAIAMFEIGRVMLNKAYEKYKLDKPYNFDMYEEYEMYSKIATKNSKYQTYSKWSDHMRSDYYEQFFGTNRDNFKHFLINELRYYENTYDCITHIMIPIMIAVASILLQVMDSGELALSEMLLLSVVTWLVIIFLVIKDFFDAKNHLSFVKDCIQLFDEQITNNEKS